MYLSVSKDTNIKNFKHTLRVVYRKLKDKTK